MIARDHLHRFVIRPTLLHLGMHSVAAAQLCFGTIAHESRGGYYLAQIGGGPALGIAQVEPATHRDNWANFLRFRDDDDPETNLIGDRVAAMVPPAAWADGQMVRSGDGRMERVPADWLLATDLAYAVAMMRVKYWRVTEALPEMGDIRGFARYWDTHYNANPDHGTEDEFVAAYRHFSGDHP